MSKRRTFGKARVSNPAKLSAFRRRVASRKVGFVTITYEGTGDPTRNFVVRQNGDKFLQSFNTEVEAEAYAASIGQRVGTPDISVSKAQREKDRINAFFDAMEGHTARKTASSEYNPGHDMMVQTKNGVWDVRSVSPNGLSGYAEGRGSGVRIFWRRTNQDVQVDTSDSRYATDRADLYEVDTTIEGGVIYGRPGKKFDTGIIGLKRGAPIPWNQGWAEANGLKTATRRTAATFGDVADGYTTLWSETEGDETEQGAYWWEVFTPGAELGMDRPVATGFADSAEAAEEAAEDAASNHHAVASRKTAMPDPVDSGIRVGDFFYSSWGYNQTNVSFYQVVALTPASVKVRKVNNGIASSNPPRDLVVPIPNDFQGEVMTKRLRTDWSEPSVTISSVQTALLWDGQPKPQTSSGWGH